MVFIWIIICIAILVAIALFLNRSGGWMQIIAFALIPTLFIIYSMLPDSTTTAGAFGIIKLVSASLGGLLVAGFRFRNFDTVHAWRVVAYLVLFINISEAVGFEIFDVVISTPAQNFGGNLLNAAAGIILLLTQAYPRFFTVDRDDATQPMKYDLGVLWVWTYLVWDFTFIYGTIAPNTQPGQWAAFALVHLFAPMLIMGRDAREYLQARSYTLPFAMLLYMAAPGEPWLYTVPHWYSLQVADSLAVVSLIMAVATLFLKLRQRPTLPSSETPRNLMESALAMGNKP